MYDSSVDRRILDVLTEQKTKAKQWQEGLRMLVLLGKVIKEDNADKCQKQNAEGQKD